MISTINGLPVYDATIDCENGGMLCVSLVDEPAVLTDFLHFKDEKQMLKYSVANEEKHLVFGVVMRADFPIYRWDAMRGEYYIIYSADTIRAMAEKYLAENRQNEVNLMHGEDTFVEGVDMVQYFIKDSAKGVSPEGFEDIADGSLFAEYHITNEEVWNAIKDGTYKGFSLEGYFGMNPNQEQGKMDAIADNLAGKFSKFKNMSKVKRLYEQLKEALLKMRNTTTDKGIIFWEGEDDLAVETEVYVENEEGERVAAPDADYTLEDGTIVRVTEGKVVEIVEPAEEEETVEEVVEEAEEATEQNNEEEVAEESAEESTEEAVDIDALKSENEALKAENEMLKAKVEALTAELAELKAAKEEAEAELAEMKKQPAADPAHEQYSAERFEEKPRQDKRSAKKLTL